MQLTFPLERCLQWLKPPTFRQLARQTGWLKRQGKIDAFDFLCSLVLGQMSALRLTLNAQAQNLAQPVARQSVHERYNPAAVAYFKAAFDYSFAELLDPGPDPPLAQALRAHFSAVYLVDSTSFDSAEKPGGYFLVLREADGAARRLSRRSERSSNCH